MEIEQTNIKKQCKITYYIIEIVQLISYWFTLISSPDDLAYADNRTIPSRSISRLSYSSGGSGSAWGPRRSSYVPGPDDSEGDDDRSRSYPLYQSHPGPLSQTSQESLNSSNPPPQVIHIHIII